MNLLNENLNILLNSYPDARFAIEKLTEKSLDEIKDLYNDSENSSSTNKFYDKNINNIFALASKNRGVTPLESITMAIEVFLEREIKKLLSSYSSIISNLPNLCSSLTEQTSSVLIHIVKKACLFDYALNSQKEKPIQDIDQNYWNAFQSSYPVVIEQLKLYI